MLVGCVAMLPSTAVANSSTRVTSDAVASAAQTDGRVVIAGVGACKGDCDDRRVYLARLNRDGSWDRSSAAATELPGCA